MRNCRNGRCRKVAYNLYIYAIQKIELKILNMEKIIRILIWITFIPFAWMLFKTYPIITIIILILTLIFKKW